MTRNVANLFNGRGFGSSQLFYYDMMFWVEGKTRGSRFREFIPLLPNAQNGTKLRPAFRIPLDYAGTFWLSYNKPNSTSMVA